MLVLSRKKGESILIGPDIRVFVVSVANGRTRLGFEAPDHVRILRAEVKPDNAGCDLAPLALDVPASLVPR
jgi:carbon storage regulator CsrA